MNLKRKFALNSSVENEKGIVPIEVKAGNDSSVSFDRFLDRPDVEFGYKFVNGNIGKTGKKITLPHYMVTFINKAC